MTLDEAAFLAKHNPILVISPHDPNRARPGASDFRGDYHPCNAEFFLENVTFRPETRPYGYIRAIRGLLRRDVENCSTSDRLDSIRAKIEQASPEETQYWCLYCYNDFANNHEGLADGGDRTRRRWLKYQGHWGSWHSRLRGSLGVIGPWPLDPADDNDLRWRDPVGWLDSLDDDAAQWGHGSLR